MGSSKDSEKCLGSWRVSLGEPDVYVLYRSLTSAHWFGGSVQVGTVSPAGQDSRLPVFLLLPLPRCPRALWPPGLPALLWIPLPLLLLTTSPRALPPPEDHPSCWTLRQLSLAPFTPAGCHGLLWALLGHLGTSQGPSLSGSVAFPASTPSLGSSSGSRCRLVPRHAHSRPHSGTAWVLQVPEL